MVSFTLLEWLSEPEGLTTKDKFSIYSAKLIYLFLRLILRLFLGKQKRDNYFIHSNIIPGKFMPYDARVKYNGFLVHVRKDDDDLNLLIPSHEPEIVKLLRDSIKEDDNFIDVGASIGKYVLLASKYIKRGRIIAIEPNPEAFQVLTENMRLNALGVECLDVAVSDHGGFEKLYIGGRGSATSSIVARNGEYVQVKSRTMDSLLTEFKFSKIDWLLIDVEGVEDKVLNGGIKTLSITNNIIVEVHSEENFRFVTTLLKRHGFEVTTIAEGYSVPHILGTRSH